MRTLGEMSACNETLTSACKSVASFRISHLAAYMIAPRTMGAHVEISGATRVSSEAWKQSKGTPTVPFCKSPTPLESFIHVLHSRRSQRQRESRRLIWKALQIWKNSWMKLVCWNAYRRTAVADHDNVWSTAASQSSLQYLDEWWAETTRKKSDLWKLGKGWYWPSALIAAMVTRTMTQGQCHLWSCSSKWKSLKEQMRTYIHTTFRRTSDINSDGVDRAAARIKPKMFMLWVSE